jgi:hypothetical protein
MKKKKKKIGENPDKLQNDQVRTGTSAPSNSKQPSILGVFFVFFFRLRIGGEEKILICPLMTIPRKNRRKIAPHFH